MQRDAERAGQPRLARFQPRRPALDDQSGGDHPAPGGDPGEAGQRLVGAALEMAGAAGERVEHRGAVDRIGARQDVGRVSGPEQDAPAPQVGPPGRLADLLGMGGEPFAHDLLGALGAALAGRGGGEVAQPGEALQLGREIGGQARACAKSKPSTGDLGAVVREDAARAAPRPPPCRRRSGPWAPRSASAAPGRAAARRGAASARRSGAAGSRAARTATGRGRRRRGSAACPARSRPRPFRSPPARGGSPAQAPDIVGIGVRRRRGRSRCRRPARRRRPRSRRRAFDWSMPPSTSRSIALPVASIRLRTASIFLQLAGDEALPAEAGIDAHHQDQVDLLEHIIERLGRRRRIERDAGALAQRLDLLDGAVEVRPGFGMDGDDVGAGLGEGLDDRDRPARSSDGRRAALRCAAAAPSPPSGRS